MAKKQNIISYEDFLKEISDKKKGGLIDIKKVFDVLLDRKKIDMITRIRDIETDKIASMYHHAHQLSVMMNKDLEKNNIKEILFSSPEKYIVRNLSLRLSWDSGSRKEFENIFISLLKTDLDMAKKEQTIKEITKND